SSNPTWIIVGSIAGGLAAIGLLSVVGVVVVITVVVITVVATFKKRRKLMKVFPNKASLN
ncbi:unnamed protein product, partial [Rotaria sp. Silwood2]